MSFKSDYEFFKANSPLPLAEYDAVVDAIGKARLAIESAEEDWDDIETLVVQGAVGQIIMEAINTVITDFVADHYDPNELTESEERAEAHRIEGSRRGGGLHGHQN